MTPGRPACGSVAEGDVGGECVRGRARGGGDARATAPASVGSGAPVGGGGRRRSTAEGDGSRAVFGVFYIFTIIRPSTVEGGNE